MKKNSIPKPVSQNTPQRPNPNMQAISPCCNCNRTNISNRAKRKTVKVPTQLNVEVNFSSLLGRGFGGYLASSAREKGKAKIIIDLDAMLYACADNKNELSLKDFFKETVVHEMLHAIEDLFAESFDEDRVNAAIEQVAHEEMTY